MADHDRDRWNDSGRFASDADAAAHPDDTTSEDVRPGEHATRITVAATRLHDAMYSSPDLMRAAPLDVVKAYAQLQRALGIDH